MATYRVKINEKAVKLEVTKTLGRSPEVKRQAYKAAYSLFNTSKRAMLREFDRHPVTQELLQGIDGANISHTLEGYGNLYAFIGFRDGEQPTEPVRELLDVATTFRQTVYKDRKWYFQINTPTQKAIEGVSRMPWEGGNSWVFGIERGISGLSHFMFKRWLEGRSGGGFQLPYENMEDAQFQKTPYLTQILANFRNRINGE